jgi:L-2,4-diaminobutyric acid acetyltransferase
MLDAKPAGRTPGPNGPAQAEQKVEPARKPAGTGNPGRANDERGDVTFRMPRKDDGAAVWQLIRDCGPLDDNSMYCNLLQCDHFADTCVVAERDGRIVGWISGYIVPGEDDTLFVWQVAVSEAARGLGVGKRMLAHLLDREVCRDVGRLKTTITRDNEASWALFGSFAKAMEGTMARKAHFERDDHFEGHHDTEYMVTIAFGEAAQLRSVA